MPDTDAVLLKLCTQYHVAFGVLLAHSNHISVPLLASIVRPQEVLAWSVLIGRGSGMAVAIQSRLISQLEYVQEPVLCWMSTINSPVFSL